MPLGSPALTVTIVVLAEQLRGLNAFISPRELCWRFSQMVYCHGGSLVRDLQQTVELERRSPGPPPCGTWGQHLEAESRRMLKG